MTPMNDPLEILPVVDERGNVIASAPRNVCHDGASRLLHPVVHLHVIDGSGRLLMQKRSLKKRIQPGRWDTAVGGHVDYGETIHAALQREALEEIGLNDTSGARLLARYVFESNVERELVYCHMLNAPRDFEPTISEPDDIEALQYRRIEDILVNMDNGTLTPNFEQEFKKIIYPCLTGYE